MASRPRGRAAVAPAAAERDRLSAGRATRVARALSAHPHRTAAGLLALLVLAYLWPALLGGGMLAPTSVLYAWAPWKGSAPADLTSYVNEALTDVPLSYYPWDVLARQLIHAGTFPAWNPHAFAGTPFFGNPEVALFSPFSLPLWTLPLTYALGVAAALKLWVAGFGAYLLARELRLGFWPALVVAISFTLCAFNVVWLSYGVFASVAALLPWALWLVERIVRRGRSVDGLALAAVAAVLLTGGHPGTQLHVLAATVLYALARAFMTPGLERRARFERLGLVAGALFVGVLAAAVTLLPAERAASGTAGAAARRQGAADGFVGANMPVSVLRTALFPDWWGRPSELFGGGPASYNERTFYAGTVALVLAAIALVSRGAWRRKAPFVLLGAIGAAVAVGAPGIHALVTHLPAFDQVQDQRMLLWSLLAVALLAGFGLQAVLDAPERRRRIWGVGAAAVGAALVAGASVHGGGDALGQALREIVHRRPEAASPTLALASVAWWTVFALGTVAILLLLARRPERRRLAGGLIALAAALDLLHFAHGYQPMGPASKALLPRTPAIAYLQHHERGRRIAGLGTALASDWATVLGLHDARGYDAPQPSLRFYRLWKAVNPAQAEHALYTLPGISPASVRIMSMLGARYAIADPGTTSSMRALAPVYAGRDATVFANALAVPRALAAAHVVVASGEDAEIAAVLGSGFDPRRDVVVRREEVRGAAPAAAGGIVRVVEEQNARVTLRATLPRPGVVLLDDAWAPGWSVAVDGRAARALQADVVLRGVAVPAGRHTIVWSYRVPGLRLGALLSALGLLAALAWGGRLAWRARRRAPPAARAGAAA